jgi:RNA polymerase sigma factor (sigma-70 family)
MGLSLDAWFEQEILIHEDALVRYIKRRWPAPEDVLDLRQEAYARVYEAAGRSRPAAAKSFLFTTARNLMADRIRRERVVSIEARGDLEELDVLVDEISPERHASARQELRLLAQAFTRLPRRAQEIVWRRRIQDLPQKEVAARLGVHEGAIEKQIANAMRRLADALWGEESSEVESHTGSLRDTEHGHSR